MPERSAQSTAGGCDRLLTVSNRGPLEHHWDAAGEVVAVPGQGGLANALRIAARFRRTIWLSSPITAVDRLIAEGKRSEPRNGGSSRFVLTDREAYSLFYEVFSNVALWFLQHSLPWPEELTRDGREDAWQRGYLPVNQAFAAAVIEEMHSENVRAVMFHDYHFYAAPQIVRRARPQAYLQHFIHVPWPEPEEWSRLGQGIVGQICQGLLANDSVVFQTAESAANFLRTCAEYLPAARVNVREGSATFDSRTTRAWANGISVDPSELEAAVASPEFSRYRWLLRPGPGQKVIVRVDRLDLTKNVVRGFQAYRTLLETHPELIGKVFFLAVLVPSKSAIKPYRDYKDETMKLVAEINQRFGNHTWKPIKLIFEHNRMQALAAMSLYDALLVNPVADGMNLVAKEAPLVNSHDGAVVLSTKAGAFEELKDAVIAVDPEDVAATAAAIYEALTLSPAERRERARRLRALIRRHDLNDWFHALIEDIDRHAPLPASTAA